MTHPKQQLTNMSYPDLCEHWAKEYVDRFTLRQLQQVTIVNLSLIDIPPKLQQARRVWEELKRRRPTAIRHPS